MMKKALLAALVIGAAAATIPAQAQTKKELVQKLMTLQQPGVDALIRNLVAQPVQRIIGPMMPVLSAQVPADKREALSKQIDAAVKKYEDETVPLVRAEALKLAPTNAAAFEEKFNEEELKVLIAWLESPVNKKFQQVLPDIQKSYVEKLVAQSAPAVDPKLNDLNKAVHAAADPYLGAAAKPAAAASAAKPKAKAKSEGK